MSVKVVIGVGYGDEGKGVTTDFLCSQDPENTCVVRFSGGHQCGHTVVKNNKKHIFSSFGSGTLSGCSTYWSKYCTFEPIAFCNEHKVLIKKGITPNIFIHPDCPVTTPYDIYVSRNNVEMQHGTTGMGFGRTLKRHNKDKVQLTIYELIFASTKRLLTKLSKIFAYYKMSGNLSMDEFLCTRDYICSLVENNTVIIVDNHPNYNNLVFEGNQGLMLDADIGYMPYCTPSSCTPENVLQMGYKIDEVYLVSRVYQTRHGNGPMTNEELIPTLINNSQESNVPNDYQGTMRTSLLDLSQLSYAKRNGIDIILTGDTKVNLVLTCTDQMSPYKATVGKTIFEEKDINKFAQFVGKRIGITGDLYINTSPDSGTIRKI